MSGLCFCARDRYFWYAIAHDVTVVPHIVHMYASIDIACDWPWNGTAWRMHTILPNMRIRCTGDRSARCDSTQLARLFAGVGTQHLGRNTRVAPSLPRHSNGSDGKRPPSTTRARCSASSCRDYNTRFVSALARWPYILTGLVVWWSRWSCACRSSGSTSWPSDIGHTHCNIKSVRDG